MTGPNVTDEVRRTYILQYAPDGAEMLEGDPTAGPPTARVPQDDPDRQYEVVVDGETGRQPERPLRRSRAAERE